MNYGLWGEQCAHPALHRPNTQNPGFLDYHLLGHVQTWAPQCRLVQTNHFPQDYEVKDPGCASSRAEITEHISDSRTLLLTIFHCVSESITFTYSESYSLWRRSCEPRLRGPSGGCQQSPEPLRAFGQSRMFWIEVPDLNSLSFCALGAWLGPWIGSL